MNRKEFRRLVVKSKTRNLRNCKFQWLIDQINYNSDLSVRYLWINQRAASKFHAWKDHSDDVDLIIIDEE